MKVWDWAKIELETLGLALYCTVQLDLSQDKLSKPRLGAHQQKSMEKVGIQIWKK